MTGRERMLTTLRFEAPDRPPHFEIMFELAEEAFGEAFPPMDGWGGLSARERRARLDRCVDLYTRIVDRYAWDALAVWNPWSDPDGVAAAKAALGDRILVGSIVGGTTWSIECMPDWTQFAIDLAEAPERIHEEAERRTAQALRTFDALADAGADFVHIVNDVAFNAGPFVRPDQFSEFVTPYLRRQVAHLRARAVIPFVHTDGNIMPILDDYLSLGAACFQSVDPMAGMDIAEVKRRCHGTLALMGNVQCSLLQDGPPEAIRESARYCLEHASPGGGYIFGTSNTIFDGMPLKHYEIMLDVYRDWCGRS
ncbi:MAG: uroporphyrinogen decarboxylase family protein [Planctomycetota bacterium]